MLDCLVAVVLGKEGWPDEVVGVLLGVCALFKRPIRSSTSSAAPDVVGVQGGRLSGPPPQSLLLDLQGTGVRELQPLHYMTPHPPPPPHTLLPPCPPYPPLPPPAPARQCQPTTTGLLASQRTQSRHSTHVRWARELRSESPSNASSCSASLPLRSGALLLVQATGALGDASWAVLGVALARFCDALLDAVVVNGGLSRKLGLLGPAFRMPRMSFSCAFWSVPPLRKSCRQGGVEWGGKVRGKVGGKACLLAGGGDGTAHIEILTKHLTYIPCLNSTLLLGVYLLQYTQLC